MGELRFLLDTCTLLWWWTGSKELSAKALALLEDPRNEIYVSAATAWEISTKSRIGKLPAGPRILDEWKARIEEDGFLELSIGSVHAARAGLLPGEHRDPFDRMLAAQGLAENLPILTCDQAIAAFGVETWW